MSRVPCGFSLRTRARSQSGSVVATRTALPARQVFKRRSHVIVRSQHFLRVHGLAVVDAARVDQRAVLTDDKHVIGSLGACSADAPARVDEQSQGTPPLLRLERLGFVWLQIVRPGSTRTVSQTTPCAPATFAAPACDRSRLRLRERARRACPFETDGLAFESAERVCLRFEWEVDDLKCCRLADCSLGPEESRGSQHETRRHWDGGLPKPRGCVCSYTALLLLCVLSMLRSTGCW